MLHAEEALNRNLLAMRIMALSVLALGAGSAGIGGYLTFVVLPPLLATVEGAAKYLESFDADIDLDGSAAKVRSTAASMPSCPEEQYGGCAVFDLSATKAELNALADSLEEVDGSVQAKVVSLEARIHQVGLQLVYLRPMMTAIVGWMFAVSIVLALCGASFLVIDKKLEKMLQRPAKSTMTESQA